MAEFYVLKREICPECKGKKQLPCPIWVEWGEWFALEEISNGHNPTEAADEIWWRARGWWNERPPETYLCCTCEGEGSIDQEISLREALDELGLIKVMCDANAVAVMESVE